MKGQEIRVRGLVQGVGFRPHVWHLAHELGLVGEVYNDGSGVVIRLVSGGEELIKELRQNLPPLARIDEMTLQSCSKTLPKTGFHIIASEAGEVKTGIAPDAATCSACLAEIIDPTNRRFRYPFTNCTHCGPRITITRAIPYDRAQTSMAEFEMCSLCQREYDNPADRRYHAQPNACPDCGPKLSLCDEKGEINGDPIELAAQAILAGKIVAIKGLGGFQLALDASNEAAVARLRARKFRHGKPLALMARDIDMAAKIVVVNDSAKVLLQSWQAPIILLEKRNVELAPSIASGQNRLGIMLPNSPLHHLLLRALNRPIVLTSGNISNEPQVIDNSEALEKLAGIADFWLLHDREIVNRIDDSVVQIIDKTPQILRRARGYAPAPLVLHEGFKDLPSILAMGADMKNTFCLLDQGKAIVSQHMGDMQNPQTQRDFHHNIKLYYQIYDFTPERVAVDMHLNYFSTRLGQAQAEKGAQAGEAEIVQVQHHHAHIAAVMAEHLMPPDAEPVIGVVLDGLGYGADGTIWGGEFLLADFCECKRLAHFMPVPLLGGDKASQQPWRNLLAHLHVAKLPLLDFPNKPVDMMVQMIEKDINSPKASSAGRLFDAVAAILGICFEEQKFEGEAAMLLQALAEKCPQEKGFYPVGVGAVLQWEGLWSGILADLNKGTSREIIASRFHNSLAQIIAKTASELAQSHNIKTIILSGGVFQNSLLLSKVKKKLDSSLFKVLVSCLFPLNDGGISLGQAAIAASKKPN